jgi:hypothetical protein
VPGFEEAGKDYYSEIKKALATGGGPGLSQLTGLLPGYEATSGLASKRQNEILSDDYMSKRPDFLNNLFGTWRDESNLGAEKSASQLAMRFGGAGHQLSSPMYNALAEDQRTRDLALQDKIGTTEYQDYNTRQQLQSQTASEAQNRTLQALGLTQEQWSNVVDKLYQMMVGGRGQMQVSQGSSGSSGGGLLGTILGGILGAATGGIGTAAGAWAGKQIF